MIADIAWISSMTLLNAWALTKVEEARGHAADVAELFDSYGYPRWARAFVMAHEACILLSCYAVTWGRCRWLCAQSWR